MATIVYPKCLANAVPAVTLFSCTSIAAEIPTRARVTNPGISYLIIELYLNRVFNGFCAETLLSQGTVKKRQLCLA